MSDNRMDELRYDHMERSFEYIREYYEVPAVKGARIVADGHPGTIVGADCAHLLILLDGRTSELRYHPTWRIDYDAAPPVTVDAPTGDTA